MEHIRSHGGDAGAAFFCLLFLAEQEKEVAAGQPPACSFNRKLPIANQIQPASSKPTVRSPAMQLTQELTFHAGNMRDALGKLKAYRPPKALVFATVIVAFVAGWLGGWSRGMADHSDSRIFFDGAMMSISAKERAEGKAYLTDREYRRAVDRMVQQQFLGANASVTEKINRLASPRFWMMYGPFDSAFADIERKTVIRFAEQRLALADGPSEQSKRLLAERNRTWLLETTTSDYIDTAAHYSMLLGREVRPEALVTDVQIQEVIARLAKEDVQKPKS
jgi:hypothetical protein